MQLTYFSDYSLRLLLYLAAHPGRLVRLEEVSRAYGISHHHLVKVVQRLVEIRVVESVRGRNGGLRLRQAPEDIRVGGIIRMTEPHLDLVECFDRRTNTCPIAGACGLRSVFQQAKRAFMDVLDTHTLADFLPHATELIPIWKAAADRLGPLRRPRRDSPPAG